MIRRYAPSNAGKLIPIVGGKALIVPDEGWDAANFARYGGAMILALARLAKIIQRREAAKMAIKLNRMFRRQIRGVNERVLEWTRAKKAPRVVDIEVDNNADLWVEAMNEVFAEAGLEAVAAVMPSVQSVMAQGYNRTSILMGQQPDDVSRLVEIQSRGIARQITAISQTTRARIQQVVNDALQSSFSVVETAAAIESAAPQIYGNRTLTISRTELNKAWTRGAVGSMQESSTITEVSVIGCEAREARSPQYQGESTCNIQSVPIQDADKLEFHINHTGNIVPSGFRNPDGTIDRDSDKPPILEEWQEISDEQADEAD